MSFDSDHPNATPAEHPAEPGWYADPSGVHSHQAYWDGRTWTGAVRPGASPSEETRTSRPGCMAIVSLASGIGATVTSLPIWIISILSFAGGGQGLCVLGSFPCPIPEGLIVLLLGAPLILGLSGVVSGEIVVWSQSRSTFDVR